jgi:hypothetical protein
MIYGRGRALFSCLGDGIHRDNLIQDIDFVTGACSCTVKEQNPGVDLLMRYNWDMAAEAISRRYGAEEGSAYEFGGDALYPELMIPSGDETQQEEAGETEADAQASSSEAIAAVDPATTTETDSATTDDVQENSASDVEEGETGKVTSGTAQNQTATSDSTQSEAADESSSPGVEVASLPNNSKEAGSIAVESSSSGGSFRGVILVGLGLLGAMVLLFGATFLVLRPR